MSARLAALRATIFSNPNATEAYADQCLPRYSTFEVKYKGFYGPWCQISSDSAVKPAKPATSTGQPRQLTEEEMLN